MRYDYLNECLSHGFPHRQYVIRYPNTIQRKKIHEMTDDDILITHEDNIEWNENKILFVIYDGGELITLQHLKFTQQYLNEREGPKLLRELRNKLLSETDYLLMIDYPLSEEDRMKWSEYRQALRDLPSNSNPTINEIGELDMTSFILPLKPNETPAPIIPPENDLIIPGIGESFTTGPTGSIEIDTGILNGPSGPFYPIGPTGSTEIPTGTN